MKTIIRSIFAAALFLSVQELDAQGRAMRDAPPEERAKFQTEQLKLVISGLTAEQEQHVYDLNLKYAKAMQNAQPERGNRVARREAMKKLSDEKAGEMKAILTETQYEVFLKHREDMQSQRFNRGGR